MDCFVKWKEQQPECDNSTSAESNAPAPNKDSVMEWIHWLSLHRRGHNRPVGEVMTKQYRLNTLLSRTVKNLGLDILEIAPAFSMATDDKSSQCGIIPALFRHWAETGKPNRASLVNSIAKCISNGVGLQMDSTTFFLGHQIVGDFESFLPGIAGEVTIDSVHFGHGGREGIDIMHITGGKSSLNENNVTSSKKRKDRFQMLHNQCIQYFLEDASDDELTAMGLAKVDPDDLESSKPKEAVWTRSIWKHLSGCDDMSTNTSISSDDTNTVTTLTSDDTMQPPNNNKKKEEELWQTQEIRVKEKEEHS